MSSQFEGRLIFPGGKQELRPFTKEMKKLRSNWVADVNWRYRKRVKLTANQWADLADAAVDTLIGSSETRDVLDFIAGLDHHGVREDIYSYLKDASRIMAKYGIALYQPGGDGTRDPGDFEIEAEEILAGFNTSPEPPGMQRPDGGAPTDQPALEPTQREPSPPEEPQGVNVFCTECGRRYEDDDRYCGSCGSPRL